MSSQPLASPAPGRLRESAEGLLSRLANVLQLAPLTVVLCLFLIAPLLIFFVYSFWKISGFNLVRDWNLNNYTAAFEAGNRRLFLNTLRIAGIASVISVVIAFAFAHVLRFRFTKHADLILLLVLVALFSGYLVRIYAWRTLLGNDGIINSAGMELGLIDQPLSFLLYSRFAAVVTLINFVLPLAILPIYAALQNVKSDEIEAARDAGASAFMAFRRITLPLCWQNGVFPAFALTFIICAGDYVTPSLVGGTSGTMVGVPIADAFRVSFAYPRGSALAFSTMAVILAMLAAIWYLGRKVVR